MYCQYRQTINLAVMNTLFLKAESWANIRTHHIIRENSEKLKGKFLSDLWSFAVDNDIVSDTYVLQRDEEPDNDIRISMNEINDTYETGERPEDLDFF